MAWGIFKRYLEGGDGPDFTPDHLPTSRVQLFFDVLTTRFGGLCQLNLLYAVWLIPLLVWGWIVFTSVFAMIEGTPAADISFGPEMRNILTTYFLVNIPLMMVAAPGTAGFFGVLRVWAQGDHAFVAGDFFDTVKRDWKQAVGLAAFNGFVIFGLWLSITFYARAALDNSVFLFAYYVALMLVAVMLMLNMYAFPMLVSYVLRFKHIIRNSIMFAIGRLAQTLLLVVIFAIPIALLVLYPALITVILLALVFLVVGLSVFGLVQMMFAQSAFDKLINPRIPGAPVNKGLSPRAGRRESDTDDIDEELLPQKLRKRR